MAERAMPASATQMITSITYSVGPVSGVTSQG